MNRIYQGRVTKVEIRNGKDADDQPQWNELPDWPNALWQHHQLFQDAGPIAVLTEDQSEKESSYADS